MQNNTFFIGLVFYLHSKILFSLFNLYSSDDIMLKRLKLRKWNEVLGLIKIRIFLNGIFYLKIFFLL